MCRDRSPHWHFTTRGFLLYSQIYRISLLVRSATDADRWRHDPSLRVANAGLPGTVTLEPHNALSFEADAVTSLRYAMSDHANQEVDESILVRFDACVARGAKSTACSLKTSTTSCALPTSAVSYLAISLALLLARITP